MADDPMDNVRHALRATLAELLKKRKVRSLSDWCAQAELPESTLRMFLAGHTRSLTITTCIALARAAGRPVSELLGEGPICSEPAQPQIQAAE